MTIPSRFESPTTFAIDTPSAMLAKLKRELNRVAEASFLHDDLVDHGTNCAITAWHITDWVWRARFKDDPAAQDDLLAAESELRKSKKGEGEGNAPPRWFKEYVTRECPALALCQDIANGFKHVIVKIPRGRDSPGAVATTASAKTAPAKVFNLDQSTLGSAGLDGPGFTPGGQMYELKIQDSRGERQNAIDVFNRAVAFWTGFLHTHHLA